MRWKLPRPKPTALKLAASDADDDEQPDGWQRHVEALRQVGIPNPARRCRAAGRRPWQTSRRCTRSRRRSWNCCPGWSSWRSRKSMLLEDGQSVAAFFELVPLGTEGREPGWLAPPAMPWRNALGQFR